MASVTVPYAILGSAALSAGTGMYGASMQSDAAGNAAQLQAASADKSLAMQQYMFNTSNNNLMPFRQGGANAFAALGAMTGTGGSNDGQIAQLQAELQSLGYQAPGTAGMPGVPQTPGMQQAMGMNSSGGGNTAGMIGAAVGGLGGELMFGHLDHGRDYIKDIADAAQHGLPISDADWLKAGYGPGGAAMGAAGASAGAGAGGAPNPNQARIDEILGQMQQLRSSNIGGNPLTAPLTAKFNPTMAQLEATPGYQFARDQGLRAMTNQMSANGLTGSGQMMGNLGQYATGLASQTYQQQFNNYWQQNQNIYDMLSGMSTLGANAAAGQATNASNFSHGMSDMITGAGQALAAGQMGSANAWAGGLSGAGSSLGNAGLMYAFNKQNGLMGGVPDNINVTPGLFPRLNDNTIWAGPDSNTAIG